MKTRSRIRGLFARPDHATPGKVPHRARPLVEALECRSVPAVVVTGLGGTLYIFDTDTSGHAIEVDQTATQGAFTVEVDSSSVGTFTGIKNINADLFVDSDTLSFDNPSSATTNLRGDLTVWAAEPADGQTSVFENFYAIKGDVSLTEGNGEDDFAYVGYAASASIGGNLSITQGYGTRDNAIVGFNISSVRIGGNLFIAQGNGNDDIAVVGDETSAAIGGNLSITQGYGAYDAAIVSIISTGVSIGGNLSITQGNGTDDQAYVGDDGSVSIGGNVFMTQGNGDEDFMLFATARYGFKNTIGRNLFLAEGDGNTDHIYFDDTTVTGNASFHLGNGSSDAVYIEADETASVGVTFTKNVSISFGRGGGATLNVDAGTDEPVTFGGQASFSAGGSGNTYIQGPDVTFKPGQPIRHNI